MTGSSRTPESLSPTADRLDDATVDDLADSDESLETPGLEPMVPPAPTSMWGRIKYFFIHTLLHTDDTPHRIALGFSIGWFITFLPTIPFQIILTFMFSWLLRANKAVGQPIVWITNPLTVVPIYGSLIVLGLMATGQPVKWPDLSPMAAAMDYGFWEPMFWEAVWGEILYYIQPLIVGCLIFAVPTSVLSYILVYRAVVRHRLRKYGPEFTQRPPVPPAPVKLTPEQKAARRAERARLRAQRKALRQGNAGLSKTSLNEPA